MELTALILFKLFQNFYFDKTIFWRFWVIHVNFCSFTLISRPLIDLSQHLSLTIKPLLGNLVNFTAPATQTSKFTLKLSMQKENSRSFCLINFLISNFLIKNHLSKQKIKISKYDILTMIRTCFLFFFVFTIK